MHRIPSIQALRAVEAFARHGTVWQAADELNLTRSAVSHQLRLLERDLGFTIFTRNGTRAELTLRGRAYAADVRKALDMVSASASRNASRGVSGSISLSCPPGLASSWLCLSIEKFVERYPEISLSISTPRRLDDTSNPEIDLFIAFGRNFEGDIDVELLKAARFTPVCSPAYLNRHEGFGDPRSLSRATLLHIDSYHDWENWVREVGLPVETARHGIRCSDVNLVYAATRASQGIAIGDEFVCRDAMEKGQLVRPFDVSIPQLDGYYLATPRKSLGNPTVEAFRDWLKDEINKV
ncbi:LysR substrate-binding domain-containing protein [Methyloligella sp. 2.7D]|uniref:LysR substrate-binding domain-containing protein n=1 Tax=unclassified Methyloligella TaxID=2625955 RepID=UPI00157C0E76|nr:LysR substrate-binding domain-containing protein [Methyloligella sp. GL2]QKP76665.1 LysR family transcriptional regulator [Methyloligella sp. GL2]